MNAIELSEIRDALDHGIKGPWRVAESDDRRWDCLYSGQVDDRPVALVIDGDTADCIAVLLSNGSALCDEVERLTDERDTLAAQVERVQALAEKWRTDWLGRPLSGDCHRRIRRAVRICADELTAALDGEA